MSLSWNATTSGTVFLMSALVALAAYMRIIVYLSYIDAGLENPPDRPKLSDKLIGYRDFCRDRGRKPIYLYLFTVGVIGAFLAWLPLPWLVFMNI